MTDTHFRKRIADNRRKGDPPICEECELPYEEITHGYVYAWACANDFCGKRFHPTFDELMNPELLIIMGRPQCYRCLRSRTMTRLDNIVRFECADPQCNELVWLIHTKSTTANKARIAADIKRSPLAMVPIESPGTLKSPTLAPAMPDAPVVQAWQINKQMVASRHERLKSQNVGAIAGRSYMLSPMWSWSWSWSRTPGPADPSGGAVSYCAATIRGTTETKKCPHPPGQGPRA